MEAALYSREPKPWQRDRTRRDDLDAAGFVLDGILSKAKPAADSVNQFTAALLPQDKTNVQSVVEAVEEFTKEASQYVESEPLETLESDAEPAIESVSNEEHEQEISRVKAQAFADGQTQGQVEGRQAMRQEAEEMSAELNIQLRDEFAEFLRAVEDNLVNAQNLFDPLKKLALTLGEQIARTELNHNDESIRRFIERSIAEIEPTQLTALVLHVSTSWYERLQKEPLQSVVQNYEVRVDDKLSIGSIRLTVQDTSIEDLIERRVQQLSEQLFTTSPISEDQQLLFPEEGDDGFVIPGDFAEVEVDDIFFNAPEE
jgi:flagellar biosynthesis/type III secretory pathway protein FliH